MRRDASSAGFYRWVSGKQSPRVQLLTVEGLLSRKQQAEHPDFRPDVNFKKAKRESKGKTKSMFGGEE
jgi:hypothetical protein